MLLAKLQADAIKLMGNEFPHPLHRDLAPVIQFATREMTPLPQLRPGNLGRGRIFHQVVQGHGALAAEPGLGVTQRGADIVHQAAAGNRALGHLQQVSAGNPEPFQFPVDLIRAGEVLIEDLLAQRHQCRMADPGTIMPVARLALLVLAHLEHGQFIGRRIILDGDLRRHAAHGMHTAPVAGLDQQQRIRLQEMGRHGYLAAIRQHKIRMAAETFNHAEDEVPAPAIETRRVLAQFIQDLVHFKRRQDGLDEHRTANRAARESEDLLRMQEHVIPEPGLKMRLHLGQVEIRPVSLCHQRARIVEQTQAKIPQRCGRRETVHLDMGLDHVPAARAHHQYRRLRVQPVTLAVRRRPLDVSGGGITHVHLAFHHHLPGGGGSVFKVRHENARA